MTTQARPLNPYSNPSGGGGAGTGDVVGPGSAVDNDIVLFNGATGKLIKDSGLKITDLTVSIARTFAMMGA